MADRCELAKAWQVAVDHGRGQGRQRAGAAGDEDAALARQVVEAGDAGDKIAAVRQVDIVGAGLDRGTGDAVILALERAGGMDQRIDAQCGQAPRQIRHSGIERQRLLLRQAQLRRQCRGTGHVAPGHQQMDSLVAGQRRANARAEKTVTAEYQYGVMGQDILQWMSFLAT